nr:DUF3164 family protein [Thiolinea sp.]
MSGGIPDGYMLNAQGHLVPLAQVREQDKLTDQVAFELAQEALGLHEALEQYKQRALKDIADLIAVAAERYGVRIGGEKGNVSITTYDGQYKITRSMANVITFTVELQAAKALIEQCIERWSSGADDRLRSLVMRAFKPNAQGELKTAAVLDLLKLQMDDPEWERAMDALRDSIQSAGTTVYVNV